MNPQPHEHDSPTPPPAAAAAKALGQPAAQGLYDPAHEKDSCGVGIVAHIKGKRSHAIVTDALRMLVHMDHRGGCGAEANTGDGAGILTSLPYDYFVAIAKDELNIELPREGRVAVGQVFLPSDESYRKVCKFILEKFIADQGLKLLGWRSVPTDNSMIGPTAKSNEPAIAQLFVESAEHMDEDGFDRALYLVRKQAYHTINASQDEQMRYYYMCSFSPRIIVYKGQLTAEQVSEYFADLRDERFKAHLAMVHSRFSTNTFPSWDRAQPMRVIAHNGEINTLRGNVNWMRARQGMMESRVFGKDFHKAFPLIDPVTSDSGMFDNVLELLTLAGRSLPHAVMMMVPEAWENHESMPLAKRAFYEYHANLMEPWDGPASITFTNGKVAGAVLDRNGLRPSRYYVTHDDMVIMASEVGVLDVPAEKVKSKGRLEPGRMFLIDFQQGRLVPDEEIKQEIASQKPYGQWLREQRIDPADLETDIEPDGFSPDTLLSRMQAFGYTTEHLDILLKPMAINAEEALGSMGSDTPLAVLSDQPRLTYDYFKQMFAQVTNPPIDPIREEIVMSLQCFIGPEGNLLANRPRQAHRLLLPHPILSNEQLAALRHIDYRGWHSRTIDITFDKREGADGLRNAIERICNEASEAIANGDSLLVLSDRAIGPDRVPVSALLATGAVHHHLVGRAERTKIGILVETGEAREIHHLCLLVGYGADAINPYLVFESLWQLQRDGVIDRAMTDETIVKNYIKAAGKGILKVMSKMGISTLASYKGAQIFEAVGLGDEVINTCFVGTASRLQGVNFKLLAEESLRRHELGYPARESSHSMSLPNPGEYQWRSGGERHVINPTTIAHIQHAARTNSREAYEQFAQLVNDQNRTLNTLRGLLRFKQRQAISIDDVEPASEIVKRFRSGAMSFGALSKEAHETLAVAMNRIGGYSNSGEGGEDPARYKLLANGDSRRSGIKQIASGRFGVTSFYLTNADVLQIKMAQGAKPGEGGQLPGYKVDAEIARVRHSTPGVGLISPPPHHDIYSIEDLAQLIFDLKNANPRASVSVKLVSEVGVGTIAAGVAKAKADHILVSGTEGGTGASPLTSIKHAGLPWELGIAETHQTLVLNDLRSRVRLETDGGLRTGRDVVVAALLGAEEYGFSTVPLITMGCIMMRKCHLNTCPVGVASQDPELRKKFTGQPEHVINYLFLVAEGARGIMAELGFRSIDEMIGRVDALEPDDAIAHWKADGLDLSPLLTPIKSMGRNVDVRKTISQNHELEKVVDNQIIQLAQPAIERGEAVKMSLPIININRAVGTMLSHEITRRYGEHGLPDDTVHIKMLGSAGQSFGAWLARGVTLELEGDANDYIGKGLSGGHVIVYPPRNATFVPEQNVIIGNVALYGATSGEAYFRGIAGERFVVRNSGARAVVEGVGDHGCEYMTGGRVVVLGRTGRNFAAGMSGGIAYVWNQDGNFISRCNLGMVDLESIDAGSEDAAELRKMIKRHADVTGSEIAAHVLAEYDKLLPQFVRVMPVEYRRVLEQRKTIADDMASRREVEKRN